MKRVGILAALAISLTGLSARADEPTFTPTPAPAGSAIPWLAQPAPVASFTAPESQGRPSRMLWIVLPALALGGAAIYVKLARRRGTGPTVSRKLEVTGTARVGPKAQVVMVSVGGRQLLLGVTEQSVQRLAWVPADKKVEIIEAKAEDDRPREPAPAPAVQQGPFAHILKTFTQAKTVVRDDSDAALKIAAETQDFVERRTVAVEPIKLKAAPQDGAVSIKLGAQSDSDLEEQVSGLRKRRAGKHG
jgi:flagellar biogenesis protein FliO